MFEAFHLPALSGVPTAERSFGPGEGVRLRIAVLTPALLRLQAEALRAAAAALQALPVEALVAAVDRVARRFADSGDGLRQQAEALLPAVTGYSPPMLRTVLDGMSADWRADRLQALLRAELGAAEVLDGFHPLPGRPGRAMALGPALTGHVFSGNVPGVAVTSLVRALLVKSPSLGKCAAGEPVLPVLFARALAEAEPRLAPCLAVAWWPGEDHALTAAALAPAEAVVVYGGAAAVEGVRRAAPANARLLVHGPRLSFAAVAREALAEDAPQVARLAAREVASFDQQGCVSPHLVYVEEGGPVTPAAWARLLAAALAELERELPRGVLAPGEAARIHQLRGEAEFAPGTEVLAPAEGTAWTVLAEADPAFAASCLNRVVRVKPVRDLAEVPRLVAAHAPLLQSVGVAAPDARRVALAAALARLGASRVAALGEMAWPPPWWHHDGSAPLGELVRWCDLDG